VSRRGQVAILARIRNSTEVLVRLGDRDAPPADQLHRLNLELATKYPAPHHRPPVPLKHPNSSEHIHAMPAGSHAIHGFKAYTAASRHERTTWIVVDEASERRHLASRSMIGQRPEIGEPDVWRQIGENLGRQPQKASALDMLHRRPRRRLRYSDGSYGMAPHAHKTALPKPRRPSGNAAGDTMAVSRPASSAAGGRAERHAFRPSLAGLLTTMALASLDQDIVSTALPRIVSELGGFFDSPSSFGKFEPIMYHLDVGPKIALDLNQEPRAEIAGTPRTIEREDMPSRRDLEIGGADDRSVRPIVALTEAA
jgi:hypothetical protein